jgi:ATP-dependent RNA helicase DDX3X
MADTWGTNDLAQALPITKPVDGGAAGLTTTVTADSAPAAPTDDRNPQKHGWVTKQAFDYEAYNMSNKQAYEKIAAEGSGARGDWASNAAVYEWNDEYGDVGPRFEELEKQLFNSEFHVKTGIEFSK